MSKRAVAVPRRRRSLRRGVALGLVLSLHAALALFLLAPRPPLWQAVVTAAPAATDALQVEFVHRRLPVVAEPVSTAARAPAAVVARRRLSRAASRSSLPPPTTAKPLASRVSAMTLDLRLHSAASGAGHSPWREALDHAQAAHRPRLPGMVAGRFVQQIRLRPRTSLKDSLRSIGSYLSCSAIRIQEEQSGHSAKLDRAAAEAGCGQN